MKYAVATVTSTFRMRYVLSEEELQSLNTDVKLDDQKMVEWLEDTVTCEEVNEFSQKFIGEQIVSTEVMDQDEVLKLFDSDNDYLADWSKEQKLDYLQKRLIQKDS
tara:strand:+ start:195 stop:512 length:318 start_codon:yes stop_codon:yes gene_type:complete